MVTGHCGCVRDLLFEKIILYQDLEILLRVIMEQREIYVKEDAFTTDSRYTKIYHIDILYLQLLDLYRIGNVIIYENTHTNTLQ